MFGPQLTVGPLRAGGMPALRLGPRDDDVEERAAIWSIYFHRFCDPRQGRRDVPLAARPVSRNAACRTFVKVTEPHAVARRRHARSRWSRSATFQRCLAHLEVTGYDHRGDPRFLKLAKDATGLSDPQEVVRHLQAIGHGEYVPRRVRAPRLVPIDGEMVALTGPRPIPLPTQITMRSAGQPTIVVRAVIPRPFENVADVIRPEHWHKLGPFFEVTEKVNKYELHEQFVVDWNLIRFDRFDVHLQVDHTRTKDVVRTDYSLMYEAREKLVIDDGFVEARDLDGGWTLFTGSKTVQFAVDYLGTLAPAVATMFLENHADWIVHAIDGGTPTAPGGARRKY